MKVSSRLQLQSSVVRRVLMLALPLLAATPAVRSLKCEVCSSGEMKDGLASIRLQFPEHNAFAHCGPKAQHLECPDGYQAGCLTQTKGKHTSKMCSNIPVQDCQVANSVEYCYCRGEMCNEQPPPQPPPAAPSNQVPKATRRPPPPPPTTSEAPKAPKSAPKDETRRRATDLQQPAAKPEQRPAASAAAAKREGLAAAALASLLLFLLSHQIATPNTFFS